MSTSTGSLIFCLRANSGKSVFGNDLCAAASVSQLHFPAFPSQDSPPSEGAASHPGQRAVITGRDARLHNPPFQPRVCTRSPGVGDTPSRLFPFLPGKGSLFCFPTRPLLLGEEAGPERRARGQAAVLIVVFSLRWRFLLYFATCSWL